MNRISRRQFLRAAGASALAARLWARAAHALGPGEKPNLLFITTDDMGLMLGCYGDRQATTPHIDRLAGEGLRFNYGFVVSTCCCPSRSAMLTGLFPHANGHYGFIPEVKLHRWVRTFPAYLNPAGYYTGLIGKFHVAGAEDQFPFDHLVLTGKVNTRSPRAMGAAVARFLREAGDKPFFLMANITDPHRPYPGQGRGNPPWPNPHRPEDVPVPPYCLDTPTVRKDLALMYDAHSRADATIGAILAALDDAGKRDSTLVVLISDHGPSLPGAKTTMFDAGIHIPFLARWPGVIAPGRVSDALVSAVDILPTFLEAAGVEVDPKIQGRSFLRVLLDEDKRGAEQIFAEHTKAQGNRYFPTRVIRTHRFKYIRNLRPDIEFRNNALAGVVARELMQLWETNPRARFLLERVVRHPHEELYDLENDPNEFHNLADDPAYRDVLNDLRERLKRWMTETDDPWIALWDYDGSKPDPFEPKKTKDGPFSPKWLDRALRAARRRSGAG